MAERGKYDREEAKRKREERLRAGLGAEMSDDPDSFETDAEFKDADMTSRPEAIGTETPRTPIIPDDEPVQIVAEAPTPVSAPAPKPAPSVSVAGMDTATALAAVLGPILQQMQAGNAEQNKVLMDSFTDAIRKQSASAERIERNQRPENKFHEDISAYNPYGERDFPRPELEGRVWLAKKRPVEFMTHGDRQLDRMHEWVGGPNDNLTYLEILLINALKETDPKPFHLVDGDTMHDKCKVSVKIERTASGKKEETLVLIEPFMLLSKAEHMNKNNFPGPFNLCTQILGADVAARIIAAETDRIAAIKAEKASLAA